MRLKLDTLKAQTMDRLVKKHENDVFTHGSNELRYALAQAYDSGRRRERNELKKRASSPNFS